MIDKKMGIVKKNKKGFATELLALLVVGIICVLFFAGWIYGNNLLKNTIDSNKASFDTSQANLSLAVDSTYGYYNTGLEQLKLIAVFIFFGFAIATLAVAYYSKEQPILLAVYVFFVILLTIFSMYVSNAYETMLNTTSLGTTLQGFTMMNFIMSYLPYWVVVIGFIGILISLGGIIMGRQQ